MGFAVVISEQAGVDRIAKARVVEFERVSVANIRLRDGEKWVPAGGREERRVEGKMLLRARLQVYVPE